MGCCVILVNYHSAGDTLRAASSVAREDGVDAMVVVDNSADREQAEKLARGLPADARLLLAPRNIGFAAACNWAYRECDSEYVLLLNPDARLAPEALARLMAALAAEPRLAAVAPATWWDDAQRWLLPTLLPETMAQWCLGALASRCPFLGRRLALAWLSWQRRLHARPGPQGVNYLSGAVLLLRRAAIDRAGGLFDPGYFMFFEDADLSRRLRGVGFGLALVPEAHAVHHWRYHAGKDALMAASALHYRQRHYPRWSWLTRRLSGSASAPCAWLAAPPEGANRWGIGRSLGCRIDRFAQLSQHLPGHRLLAISPSPLGHPAIFRPLRQAALAFAELPEAALGPGHYVLLTEQAGQLAWWAIEYLAGAEPSAELPDGEVSP
ncbi:MAG: glycosyltransferase family 2 protein [Thiobacillaceae bacterium]